MNINNPEIVKQQYEKSDNLNVRISIHQKYSTNKLGFGNWIFQQYEIAPCYNILELGCGKAEIWKSYILPEKTQLTLTDFSKGMLEIARENNVKSNISFNQVDIQAIPYDDSIFDMVIANMMLYHVPNLKKGLSEVTRVLKSGSKFYCATYGENGITEYVQSLIKEVNPLEKINKTFTLQNGKDVLKNYFSYVELRRYNDSLEVTETTDLVDYILSMSSFINIEKGFKNSLYEILESKKIDGKILVPKEYGIFICTL